MGKTIQFSTWISEVSGGIEMNPMVIHYRIIHRLDNVILGYIIYNVKLESYIICIYFNGFVAFVFYV